MKRRLQQPRPYPLIERAAWISAPANTSSQREMDNWVVSKIFRFFGYPPEGDHPAYP
jgi:hypothetical protein